MISHVRFGSGSGVLIFSDPSNLPEWVRALPTGLCPWPRLQAFLPGGLRLRLVWLPVLLCLFDAWRVVPLSTVEFWSPSLLHSGENIDAQELWPDTGGIST